MIAVRTHRPTLPTQTGGADVVVPGEPEAGVVSTARAPAKGPRDLRLDVFRGLGMFIILYAHIPRNPWSEAIPARFGFSDAAEIFVFCSGGACALAFGRAFDQAGFLAGSARIALRIWQVYWAHIAIFVAVVATLAAVDRATPGGQYLGQSLNLWPLLADPAQRLSEFATLTYVPNYFDILPMYLVILALIPPAMAIERHLGGRAVLAVSAALWAVALYRLVEMPAERWGIGRSWFFNPFSWQLIFFLGFALARGWLPAPRPTRCRDVAALTVLAASAPFSCHFGWTCYAGYGVVPWLGTMHEALSSGIDKTHLAPLRIVHFLALVYVCDRAAGPMGRRLAGVPGVRLLAMVGRQTLAVFLAGLWFAQLLGVLLDVTGRGFAAATLVNVGGSVGLIAVAAVVGWFKGAPWNVRSGVAGRRPRAADPVDGTATRVLEGAYECRTRDQPSLRSREEGDAKGVIAASRNLTMVAMPSPNIR